MVIPVAAAGGAAVAGTAATSWFVKLGVIFSDTGYKLFDKSTKTTKNTVKGLYDTLRTVSKENANLYNTAKYLNISSERLQIWQRAFGLLGYSAADANEAISSLNFAFDKLRLGEGGNIAAIAGRLKLRPEDLKSFETMMTALNKTFNLNFKDQFGIFKTLAQQLGLSESAIIAITQDSKEFLHTMHQAQSVPIISKEGIKNFREIEKRYFLFSEKYRIWKKKLGESLSPVALNILKRLEKLMDNKELTTKLEKILKDFGGLIEKFLSPETIDGIARLVEMLMPLLEKVVELASLALARAPDFITSSKKKTKPITDWAKANPKTAALIGATIMVTPIGATSSLIGLWASGKLSKPLKEHNDKLYESMSNMDTFLSPKNLINNQNSNSFGGVFFNQTFNIRGGNPKDIEKSVQDGVFGGLSHISKRFQRKQQSLNQAKVVGI